jgi:hypothetical protein
MILRALPFLVCLSCLSVACGEGLYDADGRPDVRTLGPSGGTLRSRDGVLTVVIPPGALASERTLAIRIQDNTPKTVGPGYALEPVGLGLAVPAKVRLLQTPAPGYRTPSSLARVGADGTALNIPGVWSDGQVVTAQLSSLVTLAALQPACAEQAECADGFRCQEGACQACAANVPCLRPPALPGPHNTGIPVGTVLEPLVGDVVLNVAGATLENKEIFGRLVISANDVTVRRCLVRGPEPTEINGIVEVSGSNALLEDLEIFPEAPGPLHWGVMGSRFTARRLKIHDVVTGMTVSSNTRVESSWIHHLLPVGGQYGFNVFEGSNIALVGSNVHGPGLFGAAVFVQQLSGPVSDVRVENNWLDGGGCILSFSHLNEGALTGAVARNNRFGTTTTYECAILKSTQTQLTTSGNVWDETGVGIVVQEHD